MKALAKLVSVLIFASAWNTCALHALQIAAPPSTVAGVGSTASCGSDPSHGSRTVAIAWLSDVKGDVQLAHSIGGEFQPASIRIPIIEGNVIQTAMGRAEVEFEDNSTVRLGPYSLVEFSRLELLPSGATASNVHILKGTAYASLIPAYIVHTNWNDFQLIFGSQCLHLHPSSHVRLELDAREARLAVLDGTGKVDGPFGTIELVKKRTFSFGFVGQSIPAIVKRVAANPMDVWDSSEVALHQNNAKLGKARRSLFDSPLAR